MTETIIKWKVGLFQADATKCYKEITSIGDEVTPQQIVSRAKDPDTELHKCFEWDNNKAADSYRLFQARKVLGNIIVLTMDTKKPKADPIQFRVLMKNETGQGSGYKQTLVMVKNEDEYQKLLEQAKRELRAFKTKYSCLVELSEIFALIE